VGLGCCWCPGVAKVPDTNAEQPFSPQGIASMVLRPVGDWESVEGAARLALSSPWTLFLS
jgi:hypothetical protein